MSLKTNTALAQKTQATACVLYVSSIKKSRKENDLYMINKISLFTEGLIHDKEQILR